MTHQRNQIPNTQRFSIFASMFIEAFKEVGSLTRKQDPMVRQPKRVRLSAAILAKKKTNRKIAKESLKKNRKN
jgi:hypothetical protein